MACSKGYLSMEADNGFCSMNCWRFWNEHNYFCYGCNIKRCSEDERICDVCLALGHYKDSFKQYYAKLINLVDRRG